MWQLKHEYYPPVSVDKDKLRGKEGKFAVMSIELII
jgi:hypothetical protein